MLVRVLGTIEVGGPRGATPIGSRNQRIVLSVLAAHAGTVVGSERLADAVWGDEPPPSWTSSLRTYVSRLRRVLGDELTIHPTGYELTADVDAEALHRHVAAAAELGGEAALAEAEAAVDLWRGEPFGGLDVDALRAPAEHLRALVAAARERRAALLAAAGRHAEAAAAAEAVLAEDPWREGAWVVLVDALAGDARTAEALRAAGRAVATLAEAGLEPGEPLRRAEARALADAPPTPDHRPLPVPPNPLVGRDDDVAAVERLLGTARLVSLVGPGGAGKTRLALEVAHRRAADHEWGARLVSLESVTSAGDVLPAVLEGLGLAADGGGPEAPPGAPQPDGGVASRLARAGSLDLLVVLDCCEHVIDAAADAADALIRGGSRLRILATSQERLAVAGEHVWPVGSLRKPGVARDLLTARARAVRPEIDLVDDADVARILDHLDGLPLAIELAASQLATASTAELARSLDAQPAELRSTLRGGPERHRSLRDLVGWAAARLAPGDRDLFADLAVFSGPIDADAAAAITGRPDAEAGLRRLAERSLLVADPVGEHTTFTMLGPVRACAAAELAATDRRPTLARRHAEVVLDAARSADEELRTARQATAAARLGRLVPDLRSAHRWAVAHDPSTAVALSAALHVWAQAQVRTEVLGWAAEAVELPTDDLPPDDLALALASAAHGRVLAGDLAAARSLAERGIAVAAGGPAGWAAHEVASDIALFEGRLDEAVADAGPLEHEDPHARVVAVVNRALGCAYADDRAGVEALVASPTLTQVAAPTDLAWLAYLEGEAVLDRDPARASSALERAVLLADSVDDRYVGGVARVSLCSLQARTGDPRAAARRAVEVLDHWRRRAALPQLFTTLRNLTVLLRRLDEPAAAAELLGSLDEVAGGSAWGAEEELVADVRWWVADRLTRAELERHERAGAQRPLDEAAVALRGILAAAADPVAPTPDAPGGGPGRRYPPA